jgi:NADH dehydrogenase
MRFVPLDSADHVMPEVGQKAGDTAMRVLRPRGGDVRLGTTLKEVHADHVVLYGDSRIDTYSAAWPAGVTSRR